MILKLVNSLFGVFFCAIGLSQQQDIDRFDLDSLKEYKSDVGTYIFYLNSGSQGLYINAGEVAWYPRIFLKIVNNTGEIVQPRYRSRDSHIIWMPNYLNDTLAPGDTMTLYSGWAQYYGYNMPFSSPIYIPYSIKGVEFKCTIQTWGKACLNTQLREKENSSGQTANTTVITEFNSPTQIDTNLLAPRTAYFVGGETALLSFINKNFNQSLIKKVGVTGTIYASFIIDETGKVTKCEIVKSLHPELDAELIRVLYLMPNWIPGVCDPEILVDPEEDPNYDGSYYYCKQKFTIPFQIK